MYASVLRTCYFNLSWSTSICLLPLATCQSGEGANPTGEGVPRLINFKFRWVVQFVDTLIEYIHEGCSFQMHTIVRQALRKCRHVPSWFIRIVYRIRKCFVDWFTVRFHLLHHAERSILSRKTKRHGARDPQMRFHVSSSKLYRNILGTVVMI